MLNRQRNRVPYNSIDTKKHRLLFNIHKTFLNLEIFFELLKFSQKKEQRYASQNYNPCTVKIICLRLVYCQNNLFIHREKNDTFLFSKYINNCIDFCW